MDVDVQKKGLNIFEERGGRIYLFFPYVLQLNYRESGKYGANKSMLYVSVHCVHQQPESKNGRKG